MRGWWYRAKARFRSRPVIRVGVRREDAPLLPPGAQAYAFGLAVRHPAGEPRTDAGADPVGTRTYTYTYTAAAGSFDPDCAACTYFAYRNATTGAVHRYTHHAFHY